MPLLVAAFVIAAKPFFDRPFLLGAHRGGVRSVPENTALAFTETARRYPDILLETDVRGTRDGELVLLHDETVDRTTDGKGKVADLTLAEVRRLDAGYRFSPAGKNFPYRGKGVRIATLAEALDAAPSHRFELDVKSTAIADKVADLLIEKRATDRVLLASFVPAVMTRLRQRLPDAAVCYDFGNGARLLAALRGNGWEAYRPEADVLSLTKEQVASFKITDEEIRRIRAKGIRFQIHTLDAADEIARWRKTGVDSVLTDRPDTLAYELIGRPMARAHAHNDYAHPRPLLDALDQGFASVEADIFLVDGELRVGHDRKDLQPGRTLEKLYLDPLLERVRRHGGTVHPWPGEFTLLVDIKSDGAKVYAELSKRLERYREMLSSRDPFKFRPLAAPHVTKRAVTVVLSGDRPIQQLDEPRRHWAFLDGRLNETNLANSFLAEFMPLVSDAYGGQFKWNGQGEMPVPERFKLRQLADKLHASGHRFRLWGAPDTEDAWREFYDAGVDHINTDRLAPLAEFLRKQ
ncbi:MAG: glycerophosphodiester phosphodiesterase family protein [Fimbriimonas sp.]